MNTSPEQRSRGPGYSHGVFSEEEATIGKALEHVFDRGQRVIADSVRLVRFDLQQIFRAKALGWSVLLGGVITVVFSWLALMVSAGIWLAKIFAVEPVIAVLAALHGIAGGFLVWKGAALARSAPRLRIPEPEPKPETGPEARDEFD